MTTMKWSARLGEFTGIRVYVRATFLSLRASMSFTYWQTARSATAGPARQSGGILASRQQDETVVIGVLTRSDLWTLAKRGNLATVSDVMQRDFQTADPAEMVDVVLQHLQSPKCHTYPVLQQGRLIGLVTMENVGEFISVQAARDSAKWPAGVSQKPTVLTTGMRSPGTRQNVS